MKIKVIKHRVDFSLYIEDDYNNKILFDVATIDVKKEYLYKFKKELDFDFIVLSHGHWDHGDGLKYFSNKKLICHSGSFIKRYRNKDKSYIGLNQTKQEIENKFELCLINSAKEIAKNVYFLGEISRKNDFEGKYTTFIKGNGEMDLVYDDSGICFITKKGLVIISGCSHSGICNIIEHSKKVTGIKDVYAVIGGFHLKEINEVLYKTVKYIKNQKIDYLYTGHCTSDIVIEYLQNTVNNVHRLEDGLEILLD